LGDTGFLCSQVAGVQRLPLWFLVSSLWWEPRILPIGNEMTTGMRTRGDSSAAREYSFVRWRPHRGTECGMTNHAKSNREGIDDQEESA